MSIRTFLSVVCAAVLLVMTVYTVALYVDRLETAQHTALPY